MDEYIYGYILVKLMVCSYIRDRSSDININEKHMTSHKTFFIFIAFPSYA
jgi:hypothetical protein